MTSQRLPGTDEAEARLSSGGWPRRAWHALRVRANFELRVEGLLNARGFDAFVPTWFERVRWSDRNVRTERCLFPGYVFARFDPGESVTEILQTPGVVQVLFTNMDPTAIADEEIEHVRMAAAASALPCPYVAEGERVRVVSGPLAGLEGVVVDTERGASRRRIVVSLAMLKCAASVELGESDVVAVRSPKK